MVRLLGFLEAVHFFFHAHALRDTSLVSGQVVILRDGKVLDCSPDLDVVGALARPNPAYLRIAYPDLREIVFDPDLCVDPYEALWTQVVPDAVAVEPLGHAHGFFEPVRAPGLDALRDQISALRDRVRMATAGLEVRLGLASSRMLARVAVHGEHIVLPGREIAFLQRAPLEWLPIDGRSRGELAALGLKRIAELADLPRGTLFHHLKPDLARRVLDMLHGRDASHVEAIYPPPRLEERLAPLDALDEAAIQEALSRACDRLFLRLQHQRSWPRALALIVEPFFGTTARAEGELVRPPARADDLLRRFTTLLRGLWRGDELSSLTLSADDLQALSPGQYGLSFGANSSALSVLDHVLDAVRERFGDRALVRADHLPDHRRWAEQLQDRGARTYRSRRMRSAKNSPSPRPEPPICGGVGGLGERVPPARSRGRAPGRVVDAWREAGRWWLKEPEADLLRVEAGGIFLLSRPIGSTDWYLEGEED